MTYDDFKKQLDAYAEATGLNVELVCRKATNNPRSFDRMARRAQIIQEDIGRITQFMSENPPPAEKGAAL